MTKTEPPCHESRSDRRVERMYRLYTLCACVEVAKIGDQGASPILKRLGALEFHHGLPPHLGS